MCWEGKEDEFRLRHIQFEGPMRHPSKGGQQRTEITVLEFPGGSGLEKDNQEVVVEVRDLYKDTLDLCIKGKKSDDQSSSSGNMVI